MLIQSTEIPVVQLENLKKKKRRKMKTETGKTSAHRQRTQEHTRIICIIYVCIGNIKRKNECKFLNKRIQTFCCAWKNYKRIFINSIHLTNFPQKKKREKKNEMCFFSLASVITTSGWTKNWPPKGRKLFNVIFPAICFESP